MGRRSGYGSFVTAMARAGRQMEKAARQAEREQRRLDSVQRRAQRDYARAQKDYARTQREIEKLERQQYLEEQEEQVAEMNSDIKDRVTSLRAVLEHTLDVDDSIVFESLKQKGSFPAFVPKSFNEPPPKEPNMLQRLLPGGKASHESAMQKWQQRKANFINDQEEKRVQYLTDKANFDEKLARQHLEVDQFSKAYLEHDQDAVETYNNMVLERSVYPDDFPQKFRVAFVPESKELVIEYMLPDVEIIPKEEEYRYVKAKDEISSKPKKAKEIKDLYQDLVAAIAIRTIHEVLEADQAKAIAVVAFNGYVQTRDLATGKKIKPCLISLRVTSERFAEIDLEHIDKKICLRNLGAQVSARPDEMLAVKPVVEFDMIDKRFIEQGDLLSELESRPNLMDLSPSQFENLVSKLFEKLGLESKLTRSSRDGGVDCIAFDNRPVLGGKVVIQAKRYRHTVGVSAVRDLYGTMQHEGANKGILVTTSGYGPDAFDFSKDKPIELIGGSQLLYLLDQVGVDARIVFPDEKK